VASTRVEGIVKTEANYADFDPEEENYNFLRNVGICFNILIQYYT
jgi:hypothetical protein